MDLNDARCYHTMYYNDAFNTLMIIGGEFCNSVEIFDPVLNRWLKLPNMITPRANIYFYFDKPRGLMYALSGIIGKVTDQEYSDTIEVFDLTEIQPVWKKVDYDNKPQLMLRKHINFLELSNGLLLCYGGETSRKNKRIPFVIDLTKQQVEYVTKKIAEQLFQAAKKSLKLSRIISSFSLENIPNCINK